tara:strand:- start:509 stop:679 length:171 start_codon:yes stop_codon:yes gene_type:complete
MNLVKLREMSDNQRDCNFHEVQMYALVEIASSLKNIEKSLSDTQEVLAIISLVIQE